MESQPSLSVTGDPFPSVARPKQQVSPSRIPRLKCVTTTSGQSPRKHPVSIAASSTLPRSMNKAKSAPIRRQSTQRDTPEKKGVTTAPKSARKRSSTMQSDLSSQLREIHLRAAHAHGGAAVDVSETQYSVVSRGARRAGLQTAKCLQPNVVIKWDDACLKPPQLALMRETGLRWNHFPGIERICTKCGLQQTLARVCDAFPKRFRFVPRSWSLPVQRIKLDHYMRTRGAKEGVTLIVKPNTLSRGRGIYLTKDVPEISSENVVAQVYIERPLTINSLKFDLRMYVLVTDMRCCDDGVPRVFLHHEGLVRFCTTPYEPPTKENLNNNTQHLSNYSVNKWSAEFVRSESTKSELHEMSVESEQNGLMPSGGSYLFANHTDGRLGDGLRESALAEKVRASRIGSKWTLTAFAKWADENGHDVGIIWKRCCDLVAKTVIAAAVTGMRDQYNSTFGGAEKDDGFRCFELMGIDVVLDEKLQPYLLEVNMSPSAATDTALDLLVKETIHEETLKLAVIGPPPKDCQSIIAKRLWREEQEASACNGFERILPVKNDEKLKSIYSEMGAFKKHKGAKIPR